jgi:hypothetical protein
VFQDPANFTQAVDLLEKFSNESLLGFKIEKRNNSLMDKQEHEDHKKYKWFTEDLPNKGF